MGTTSKTTTESKPPAWAQPLFTQSASEAQNLYNSGAGGNVYQGSTVAPLSDTTMYGINALSQAGNNSDTSSPTRPLYQGIGAASVAPSYSEQNLNNMANGSYLESGNPYYMQNLQSNIDRSNALLRSQFSGMGRYGSNANQDVIDRNTKNMLFQGLENDWNRNQQNMLTANSYMDQARNQGLNRALDVTNQLYGQNQNDFSNAITGANAINSAGGMLDAQAQKNLADEVNKYYALDNADWNRLGMLQQAAAGAAGNYGTQNSTQRTSGLGGLGSILGGVGSMAQGGMFKPK